MAESMASFTTTVPVGPVSTNFTNSGARARSKRSLLASGTRGNDAPEGWQTGAEYEPNRRGSACRQAILAMLLVVATGAASADPGTDPLRSHEFELRQDDSVLGSLQRIRARQEDTLSDLGRLFNLGYEEITRANPGVDPWLPGQDADVLLPTLFVLPEAERKGLVLNMAGMRIYYFRPAGTDRAATIFTHPIGIGRVGWSTPLGTTRVTAKATNPSWYVPESIREEHAAEGDPLPKIVPPGPSNPLGRHVLRLALPSYLIHGTNKPWGVGMRVSHGCIRLYPEDIEALYAMVPVGTAVQIVDQPYLAGWHEGRLLFTAYHPLEEKGGDWLAALELLDRRMKEAPEGASTAPIDWGRVARITREGMGVAYPVQEDAPDMRQWLASVPTVRIDSVANYRPDAAETGN
jgi:L,D-transpeptidase ErfK/SrfK